jgi:hypothetical protein
MLLDYRAMTWLMDKRMVFETAMPTRLLMRSALVFLGDVLEPVIE